MFNLLYLTFDHVLFALTFRLVDDLQRKCMARPFADTPSDHSEVTWKLFESREI